MEPNKPSNDITPPQRPTGPVVRRPLVSDFGPARPAVRPMQRPPQPQPAPRPATAPAAESEITPTAPNLPPEAKSKQVKEPHETAHAGLIGFVVFVILAGLLLSPFLPGKILDNFPSSSVSFSTGVQTIGCATTLGPITTTTTYTSKLGTPLVYRYATNSTIHATCQGKVQTATSGQLSSFNPLAGLIDLLISVVGGVLVAWVWRKIFAPRRRP